MNGSAAGDIAEHDRATGRFTAGNSEYHARKRRLAALTEQLAAEYLADSPISRKLIAIAAAHLDQAATTRNSALRGRATRLAAKVLDRLQRRPPKPVTLDKLTVGA